MRLGILACAVTLAASLAACQRGADSGATANSNAPGSPGTSEPTRTARPQAPDGPPGGPSGVAGSAPHTGASGADAVPGTTGKGTADASGRSQTAQPGTGLQGGLGASNGTNTMGGPPAHAATDGATNRTPKGSFGNRP